LPGDIPGEEFVDAIDGMLSDTFQDVAQIGLGVEVVEFGGSCRAPDYAE